MRFLCDAGRVSFSVRTSNRALLHQKLSASEYITYGRKPSKYLARGAYNHFRLLDV